MRNMYIAPFIDIKKVEDSAYKRSVDKFDPEDVIVHYHQYSEPCSLKAGSAEMDDNHKKFVESFGEKK